MTKSLKINLPIAASAGLIVFAAACGSGGGSKPEPTSTAFATLAPGSAQNEVLASPTAAASSERVQLTTSVSTRYYIVSGTTTAEIFDSIDRNGPRDGGVKAVGLAAASWGYTWQPQPVPEGCTISSMMVTLDVVVTLPRHQSETSLSQELRSRWNTFAANVAAHEQTHVEIDQTGARAIRDKMAALKAASSCDALTRQVDALWAAEQAAIEASQDRFHSQEDARIAAQRAPLQGQIDSNRARISQLSAEIQSLDATLAQMNKELTNVDDQLEALKKGIDGISTKYPNADYPPAVFGEYNEFVRLYNALAPSFNLLVGKYNEAIAQRNNVADQHDDLVNATNTLVDEFNWTR